MLFIAPFRKKICTQKEEAIMKAKAKEDAVFFIDQNHGRKLPAGSGTHGRTICLWIEILQVFSA